MITCLKHKVDFVGGECPKCKALKDGISLNYKSSNPEHDSEYNLNGTLKRLREATEKLKKLNESIDKIRELYKPKGKK